MSNLLRRFIDWWPLRPRPLCKRCFMPADIRYPQGALCAPCIIDRKQGKWSRDCYTRWEASDG